MPVILRLNGYRFFFYANEGSPLESAHIHVRNAHGEAKFWLQPEVAMASSHGLDERRLRRLAAIINLHKTLFMEAWNDYFS